jgi:hypothetical protein
MKPNHQIASYIIPVLASHPFALYNEIDLLIKIHMYISKEFFLFGFFFFFVFACTDHQILLETTLHNIYKLQKRNHCMLRKQIKIIGNPAPKKKSNT